MLSCCTIKIGRFSDKVKVVQTCKKISNCIGQLQCLITPRRYASAVYAVAVCLSIRPSVRLSHAGIVPERLSIELRK